MEEVVSGRWAVQARSQNATEIRQAFARADIDGSGGIDISEFANAVAAAKIDERHARSIFDAADANGDGVIDLDEFVQLVASSCVLRPAFGQIMAAAKERRERAEFDRLSSLFRNPAQHYPSPSTGRRRRPSLFDLRVVHEVIVPGSRQPPAPAVAAYSPNAIKPAKTGAHAGA